MHESSDRESSDRESSVFVCESVYVWCEMNYERLNC